MASSVNSKMNHILPCDWLPEWARWSYLEKNFPKSYITNPDQAFLVKMPGYWPYSFSFSEFMDLKSIPVQKYAQIIKKELGHYQAILTSDFVNNPYLHV